MTNTSPLDTHSPDSPPPPLRSTSGRYASNWNAFLFEHLVIVDSTGYLNWEHIVKITTCGVMLTHYSFIYIYEGQLEPRTRVVKGMMDTRGTRDVRFMGGTRGIMVSGGTRGKGNRNVMRGGTRGI